MAMRVTVNVRKSELYMDIVAHSQQTHSHHVTALLACRLCLLAAFGLHGMVPFCQSDRCKYSEVTSLSGISVELMAPRV